MTSLDKKLSKKKTRIALIFLAGGQGKRFGSKIPKQFLPHRGMPIACHSLKPFLDIHSFDPIVIVAKKKYHTHFTQHFSQKKMLFAKPGKRRQDSLASGIRLLKANIDFVCIHDAARPFITRKEIKKLLKEGLPAATLGYRATDSVKECNPQNFIIEKSLPREKIFLVQTPQLVPYKKLIKALQIASQKNFEVTDDVSLMELVGQKVKIVEGLHSNKKITYPEDVFP